MTITELEVRSALGLNVVPAMRPRNKQEAPKRVRGLRVRTVVQYQWGGGTFTHEMTVPTISRTAALIAVARELKDKQLVRHYPSDIEVME